MEGISLSTSQLLIANPYLLSGLITLPDRSAIHGCPHIANDRRDTGAGLLRVAQVGGDLTDQHRTHHYPVSHTGDRGGGGAVTNTKTDTDRQIGDGAQLLELFCYLGDVQSSRSGHTLEDRKSTRLNSSHVRISYAV